MVDINKHKVFMLQILKDIYSDLELANYLGFKGGTALMLFCNLPRFSVDLDFNILNMDKENEIYDKVRAILQKHGKIHDEAKKIFGLLLVLDYGSGERKLKVEMSNRKMDNHYEILNFMGINMLVMTESDMFAHKLCALLDRNKLTNRDIFDCWFLMQKRTPINQKIIENRMNKPYSNYIQECIHVVEKISPRNLLNGLGELVNPEIKTFIRNKLHSEIITLMNFYKEFPVTI